MIHTKDVESAILSAFLFQGTMDFHKPTDIFKLDVKYFNTGFKKRLAENINEAIEKGVTNFQLLGTRVEDKVENTKFHLEFIDVLAQTPIGLDVAKEYHDVFLGNRYKEKALFGEIA